MAIELSFQEEFAVLTLNRPEALNALSFALIKDIGTALDKVSNSGCNNRNDRGGSFRRLCANGCSR